MCIMLMGQYAMTSTEEETFAYNLKCKGWRELNGALCLNNRYCDIKQSCVFRKRICWPSGFLQLEFKLSVLSSSIFGLRLNAFICDVRACYCSQYGLLFVFSMAVQKDAPQMQNSSFCVVAFQLLPRIALTDSTVTTHASDLISCVNLSLDHILSFLNLNKISTMKFSQILFFCL